MPAGTLEIFLNLDGVDGESTVRGHERETVVLSYEQGVDQEVIREGGGGGSSAGRATFSGVRFRKPVDVGSVPLLLACASGVHIRNARFTFRKPAPAAIDFYIVTLEDVLVTGVTQRAGTGAQYPLKFEDLQSGAEAAGLIEEVSLDYGVIRWEYRPQRPDGSLGTPVQGGWDRQRNRKV